MDDPPPLDGTRRAELIPVSNCEASSEYNDDYSAEVDALVHCARHTLQNKKQVAGVKHVLLDRRAFYG